MTTKRRRAAAGCGGCVPSAELAVLADVRIGPFAGRSRSERPSGGVDEGTTIPTDSRQADLVVHGSIVTMDPARPTAEALAVRDGRIVAVGTIEEVDRHAGPQTEVVELGDDVCYPGFIDPHMHIWTSVLFDGFLDCSPLTHDSHAEIFDLLADAGRTAGEGAWVRGKLWDPALFPDAPALDRDLLDQLVPDHPALVMNASMHFAYLNSKALSAVGLADDAPDPDGGTLGRRDGRLDGVLGELGAIVPALAKVPGTGHDEFMAAIVRVGEQAAAAGVTKVHEAGSGTMFGSAELDLLAELAEDGRLPVRVTVALFDTARAALDGCAPGDGDDLVRAVSWKLVSDGSNQGRSGFLRAPYLASDERGRPNYSDEDLRAAMTRAHGEGWQLMVHANGDAAIDQVLDAYESIGAAPERRHRIEHSSLADDAQFARMAELGVSPSFLMNHVYYWGHAFRDDILGPERADLLDAAATALRHGLRISFHSDFGVTPISPLRAVQTAVTRGMRAGGTLNPAEAITVEQAMRAVTIDAAWQTHSDDQIGSIEVGKYADLVFLDADPRRVDPTTIADIAVLGTRLAGHPVHRS